MSLEREMRDGMEREAGTGRPSWREYFMEIAGVVARRSTCLRRQVGAVLVRERRILTTGYNGAPRGLTHCSETGCIREEENVPSGQRHELCRGLHAEQNSIIQASVYGLSIAGATLYCTTRPCSLCTKMLINAGVERFVFRGDYDDPLAREMIEAAGIDLVRMVL